MTYQHRESFYSDINVKKPTLAKISGDYFTDVDSLQQTISQINPQHLIGNVLMCGGGNIVRGGRTDIKIDRNYVDQVGMMSTVMNAMYLSAILHNLSIPSQILTPQKYPGTCLYNPVCARELMKTHVVILAGGLGCGYMSTDIAMIVRALELKCQPIKVTNVGGIFDKDPKRHNDACKIESITYQNAMQTSALDAGAVGVAMDHNLQIRVMDLENYASLYMLKNSNELDNSALKSAKIQYTTIY